MKDKPKNANAVALGAMGGKSAWKTNRERMLAAVRANGRKGGAPKKTPPPK